jgi:peroxiredoxin
VRRLGLGTLVLLCARGIAGATDLPDRVVAETGPPVLDETGGTPIHLWDRASYERQSLGYPLAIPPERDPAHGDDTARYGTIGFDAPSIVTFVVTTEGEDGRALFVDRDRDGDLADERPIDFARGEDGLRARFTLTGPHVPLGLDFPENVPDWLRGRVLLNTDAYREGVLSLGGVPMLFAVRGTLGEYGRDHDPVVFDTNGDGALDTSRMSEEVYRRTDDAHVNLAGASWSFEVDSDGSRLTLTRLAWLQQSRPSLAIGEPAPDFEYVDVAGRSARLSEHRGGFVLLYFWATWCSPCARETRRVLEAHREYAELGLDVIGIAGEEDPSAVASYTAHHGIPWPQVVEPREGTVANLYRVAGRPHVVLVDREGEIAAYPRGEEIGEAIRALLDAESPDTSIP